MHRRDCFQARYHLVLIMPLLAAAGCAPIPEEMEIHKRTGALEETVDFAGYEWRVRTGYCSPGNTAGPGPNYWCGDSSDAWVDQQDRLHLEINYKSALNAYAAVEVETDVSGCGVYTFTVEGDASGSPDGFDENVVLGMFSYSDAADADYHEIDIEISDWGDSTPSNTLFYTTWDSGEFDQDPFDVTFGSGEVVHTFNWQPNQISFASTKGSVPLTSGGSRSGSSVYLCPTSQITARINLWLYQGVQPDAPQEVVISDFSFVPYVDLVAPSSLSATADGSTAIDLSWTDNAIGEEGFEIERKIGAGSFALLDTVGPDVDTYRDEDLEPDTTATYRVRAFNGTTYGSYSSSAVATTDAEPELTEIDYSFAGWSGFVSGQIQDPPASAYHVRTWVYIPNDLVYTEGSDLSPDSSGDFNAQYPGLWGSDDGREIYVTLHPAATDQYGTAAQGANIPTWNWPSGLSDDVIVFGPFETGLP